MAAGKSPKSNIIIRLPALLHRQLKNAARYKGVSLNRLCTSLLEVPLPVNDRGFEFPPTRIGSIDLGEIAESLKAALGKDLLGIVLYGSSARAAATRQSDIDLLLVLDSSVDFDRDLYDKVPMMKVEGRDVSPLIVKLPGSTDDARGIWLEIALEGLILSDTELIVHRYLCDVRKYLIAGRAQRCFTHGHPYWVHQREVQ